MVWARLGLVVAGSLAALVGAVGLLHLPAARPLLAATVGCPVGKASAADIELARAEAVRATRGAAPAPSGALAVLPVLASSAPSPALERTGPEDVRAWATARGASCEVRREGLLVVCHGLRAALGVEVRPIDDVAFAFRPSDRALVNVTATWLALPADEASRAAVAAAAALEGRFGAPTGSDGELEPARLGAGGYATAVRSWRFADALVDVTATSFGARGASVRVHLVSARDGA